MKRITSNVLAVGAISTLLLSLPVDLRAQPPKTSQPPATSQPAPTEPPKGTGSGATDHGQRLPTGVAAPRIKAAPDQPAVAPAGPPEQPRSSDRASAMRNRNSIFGSLKSFFGRSGKF